MRAIISIVIVILALSAAVFAIAGMQGRMSRKPPIEVFSDMDRQLKLRPQKPNHFFVNGVSSQLPPPGTIARSSPLQTANGAVYSFEDSPVNTGRVAGKTNFIEVNPLRMDAHLLTRGRERFDIYCAPCHGKLGDGNGITKKIGDMPAVANLHEKRMIEMPDGEIFNTITFGKNTMGAYGSIIPAEDRWVIVSYLRALQLSRLGSVDDLTPGQRATLK
jgi:mono/diheme cytochrome c family protein